MAENKEMTSPEQENLEITAAEETVEKETAAEETAAEESAEKEKGGLKKLMKSRKMRHGSLAVALTAIGVAAVILLNVIASLLVDRFPELKADFTSNNAFALNDDTADYMSRLKKDVTLHIVADEDDFLDTGTYFVQAKNLLDKMVSKSNGKFSYDFVNTTKNPTFVQKYPNINWTTNNTVGVIECGDDYKGLSLDDCFTYDEEYYQYDQSYKWTGTTIEQAVVKGALYVTSDDRVVVDVLTGEGESGYEGVTTLLTDNAYQVNEVSLLTGELDKNAEIVLVYAPQTDISDTAAETLRSFLNNGGKYGKTLIYVPNADPRLGESKTPNFDSILSEWGMSLNSGYIYETNNDYLINGSSRYMFIAEYTDYYVENLKNQNVPVAVEYAQGVNIKDTETAHAILQTSDGAGVYPLDAGDDFDAKANVKGEPIAIAAEGKKSGTEEYSSVVVFSSSAMLSSSLLNYYSFNNGAFFMNVVNTIAEKDDDTVVIESRSLQNPTLGAPSESTCSVIQIIFVYALPAVILIIGIILWIRRRNR